jgi:hypothetical protein
LSCLSKNDLKQGDALSSLIFSFALEYVIRKVHENQVGLKLNGAYRLLAYSDDVNLLGDDTDTIKENAESLTGSSKCVGLKVNTKMQGKIMTSR